jgi:predicted nucleotidyltransferase
MDQHALNNFCISSGIDLIVLFGSASKGTECQESDIDIAVKMRAGSIISKLDLINEMGKLFDDREIDLVVLSVNTDPVLLYEIFSYGKPLYESLPDLFANERLRAFNLYFDTEKLRRLQSEHLKDFVERFRNVA